ncbi:MAG: DUF1178 family protein [Alphaproteobacteria bacterium]|nr:DUF1178 family protein [Alphaproteobacteria bacterium]
MIVFDLRCEDNHVFEAWFQNSDAYESQVSEGHIHCPFCGSSSIVKSLMSPNIVVKSASARPRETGGDDYMVAASAHVPETMEASAEDVKRALKHMHDTMKKFRSHVKKECEYVGENFASEVRAIHVGEAESRGIYGEVSLEETEDLLNDGIDILPVPGLGKLDS